MNRHVRTTTTILIPTTVLPLLKPFVDAGFAPEFIDFMDSLLRPMIDWGYRRPKMQVGIPPTLAAQDLSVQEAQASAPAALAPPSAENRATFQGPGTPSVEGPTGGNLPARPTAPVTMTIATNPEVTKKTVHENDHGAGELDETIEGSLGEDDGATVTGEAGLEPADPPPAHEDGDAQDDDGTGDESADPESSNVNDNDTGE